MQYIGVESYEKLHKSELMYSYHVDGALFQPFAALSTITCDPTSGFLP